MSLLVIFKGARERRRRSNRSAGFALVITLIVIALLTVIVTAFLASSSTDRLSARAYLSRSQADAAARGAADEAMATLKWAFENFPDSATTWNPDLLITNIGGGPVSTGGTEFWFHATGQTKPDAPASTNNFQRPPVYDFARKIKVDRANSNTFIIPLVSGLATQTDANLANGATPPQYTLDPTNPSTASVVDLNVPLDSQDKFGWIGSPTLKADGTPAPSTAPRPTHAPWVEVKDATGLVVTRYAWWAEDESFRVNVNFANAISSRTDNAAEPVDPLGSSDISLVTALRGALGGSPSNELLLNSIYQLRQNYPATRFPETETYYLASASGSSSVESFGPLRFLLTTKSSALNLSRHGSLRLNLDRLGPVSEPQVATTSPTNTSLVQTQVDRLVSALAFHLPDLGQRFIRGNIADRNAANQFDSNLSTGGNPFSGMARIYFHKTAASIRDYLDQDSVPTVLALTSPSNAESPLEVIPPVPPKEHPGEANTAGPNPYSVIGKEAGPFIHKAASKYQAIFSGLNFTLRTHYYAVLWNPSDRDIKVNDALGTNAFVLFRLPADGAIWVDQKNNAVIPPGGQPTPTVHVKIFIRGTTLPAKSLTVVTTDPDLPISGVNVIRPPTATVEGTLNYSGAVSAQPGSGNRYFIKMLPMPTGFNLTSSNYEHNVVLGSDRGFIDGAMGCPTLDSLPNLETTSSPEANTFARGGRLRGNDTFSTSPSQTGDSRSNNEQLKTQLYIPSSAGNLDATRFTTDSNLSNSASYDETKFVTFLKTFSDHIYPGTQASGKQPWSDFYEDVRVATPAGGLIAFGNDGIRSIGELGQIYDPSRFTAASGTTTDEKYKLSRGGGRSFQIGQPDDLIDPRPLSPSLDGWASWRLTDVLSTRLETQRDGLVNINGILRDHGVALRAALAGLTMQPPDTAHGAPQTSGRALASDHTNNSPGIEALAQFLRSRFQRRQPSTDATSLDRTIVTWGPLFERGEVSECPLFNGGATSGGVLLSGVDLSRTYDRGREELFRRMSELITTKGNTFSVYCVGQSIFQAKVNGPRQVLSTQRMKVTFRLKPIFADAGNATYDPETLPYSALDQTSISKRFAKPSRYEIQILEISPGP